MSSKRRKAFRNRLLLSIFLVVSALTSVGFLAVNVMEELRLLNSARSDNVQWTLSQTEVEFLELERTVIETKQAPVPDLSLLRREFDIFYSRINTLSQSGAYAGTRQIPEFARNLALLRAFLDRTATVMDGSDAALVQGLPALSADSAAVRQNVRRLSNSGLDYFANDSDQRRENISQTLIRLALGVTLLLVTLLLLALYLGRLNRLNVRRSREALQAGKRTSTVIDTALDAVLVTDAQGAIVDFNAAAEQTFGYAAADVIGRDLAGLILPEQAAQGDAAGTAQAGGGGVARAMAGKGRIKTEAKRASGDVFPVEVAIQSAESHDGGIFIAFLRDISHRVAAERDLVEARDRALAGEKAKTDFLATMSHEIRTPLNGLLGNLTLLQDTELSARQQQYIKNMNTSGKLLMSHISDVLDITKYDAGKLQLRPVDMNISLLVQDIVDNQSGAAAARDTRLSWHWDGPASDWISADSARLQHVLMNVIGNAVKFTAAGQVTIVLAMCGTPAQPRLRFTIKDTGIGIAPELQSEIFGDFMTGDNSYARDVEGTGLGLGIAQRFVTAMEGTIGVESTPGVGSTFEIELPVMPVDPPATVAEAREEVQAARALEVLLVEDNEINRMVAREMLRAEGHHVTDAHNGQIAVAMAQQTVFDLILMDISMPVMDGRAATRAIRAGGGPSAQVPIVALTANAVAEEQQAFLSDGMNDVLTKPLSREGLVSLVARYGGAQRGSHARGGKPASGGAARDAGRAGGAQIAGPVRG